MPDVIGGRFELHGLVSVQGLDGVYRCPRCNAPCSMMGHRNCPVLEPCDFCGSSAVERGDAGLLLGCSDCGYEHRL